MNRLHKISVKFNITQQSFIAGTLNLADLCTRYAPFSILKDSNIWFVEPKGNKQAIAEEKTNDMTKEIEKKH